MAIGKAGAKNAAIFAIQILSLKHPILKKKLALHKKRLAADVSRKARQLAKNLKNAR